MSALRLFQRQASSIFRLGQAGDVCRACFSRLGASRSKLVTQPPRRHFAWLPNPTGPQKQYVRFGEKFPNGQTNGQANGQYRNRRVVVIGSFAAVTGLVIVTHLEQVPITGRWRFNVVSKNFEESLGQDAYQQFTEQFNRQIVPPFHPVHVRIRGIVDRILKNNDLAHEEYTLTVIDDPTINCFVTPGRHIFVFTGIFKVCDFLKGKDDELAFIMGHEIGHALAHHTGEKVSWGGVLMLAKFLLVAFFGFPIDLTNSASELLVGLPNSRQCENEADTIGLMLATRACYNPEASISTMQKLSEVSGRGIEFLATHPLGPKRVKHLEQLQPEAKRIYEDRDCAVAQDFHQYFSGLSKVWR